MVNPQIFRQYDIRGIVDKDLTNETLYLIGRGFGSILIRKGMKNAVIAGDARLSTPRFKENFIKGLLECGIDVIDVGIMATPVLYYSIWKMTLWKLTTWPVTGNTKKLKRNLWINCLQSKRNWVIIWSWIHWMNIMIETPSRN